MGWAEDQAVNFVETAGGLVPDGLPEDTSSLLYHVRKLKEEIEPHIGEGTSDGDTTAAEDTTTDDTTSTDTTVASGEHPHEPDGFTRVLEHDFSFLNSADDPGWHDLSHDGVHAVARDRSLALIDDPTAPASPPGVLDVIYPEGLGDGGVAGWVTTFWSDRRATEGCCEHDLEEMYISVWIKIVGDGETWAAQSTGSKIPFYLAQGSTDRRNHSPTFTEGGSQPAGGVPEKQTEVGLHWFIYEMEDDGSDLGGGSVRHGMNVKTKRLQVGAWHQIEFYAKMNTRDSDPGRNDGVARWWISDPGGGNLELVGEFTDIRWGSATNPTGFYNIQLNPIWGGDAGETKDQEDHWYMDHLYVSGVEPGT